MISDSIPIGSSGKKQEKAIKNILLQIINEKSSFFFIAVQGCDKIIIRIIIMNKKKEVFITLNYA